MRLGFLARMLVVFALAAASAPPAQAATPAGAELWNAPQVAWHDMASGVPEAERTGKVALLVFHANWCQVCRKFRAVFRDAAVVEASRGVVMILVDIDQDPDLNSSFAPDGAYVPRTVFVTPEGDVIKDLQSSHPEYRYSADPESPGELLSLLKRAGAQRREPVLPGQRAEQ